MADQPHYFSVEEANAALSELRPLLGEILAIRSGLLKRQPEAWPAIEKAAGNGGSRPASELVQDFERLDRLVRQVQATGVILKDVNTGLVDFLAVRDGREVYLCWQYDEPQVLYWHDIEAGFAGRQRLE